MPHHKHHHTTSYHFLSTCPFHQSLPNVNKANSDFCFQISFLRTIFGLDFYYFITLIPNILFILFLIIFKLRISLKIIKKTESILLPTLYTFVWGVCVIHLLTSSITVFVAFFGEINDLINNNLNHTDHLNVTKIFNNLNLQNTLQNNLQFYNLIKNESENKYALINYDYKPSPELDNFSKISIQILHFLIEFIEISVLVYMLHHFTKSEKKNQKILIRSLMIGILISLFDNIFVTLFNFLFPFYNELYFPSTMINSIVMESALYNCITKGIFMTLYGSLLFLPFCNSLQEKIPKSKAFYLYLFFLFLLNMLQAIGCILILTCQSVGLCLVMVSKILYSALFGPILYFTFLNRNFNREAYDQLLMAEEEVLQQLSSSNNNINNNNNSMMSGMDNGGNGLGRQLKRRGESSGKALYGSVEEVDVDDDDEEEEEEEDTEEEEEERRVVSAVVGEEERVLLVPTGSRRII
ncbi:hypothetical protein ABK040_003135 [Willaertia magna]